MLKAFMRGAVSVLSLLLILLFGQPLFHGLEADDTVVRRIVEELKRQVEGDSERVSDDNALRKILKERDDAADRKRGRKDVDLRSSGEEGALGSERIYGTRVFIIRVEGAIGPAVASYVVESLERASKEGAGLFVILLDTPGGLDAAMRDIVRAIESSYVPVCVFVWPVGARAASAGAFITVASHVAAMAPGTSIGAASPVLMGGEKMDDKLRKKIENDAVAYMRALAQRHKRNGTVLEKMVKEAATYTAEEALRNGVIDIIAENVESLLQKISGKTVTTVVGEVKLELKSYEIVRLEPNIKHKLLKVISDPNIAYILMTIGIWGIFFELANPGAIFPGVIGAICLVLGLYSLQALPVNWAGIALILLAIVFFLLEVKLATSGILALAGIFSMFLGSVMLFESPEPIFRASYNAIITTTLATALFFIFVAYKALAAQRTRSIVGYEGLLEQIGTAIKDFEDGRGKIFVNGEIWNAQTDEPQIKRGDRVKIISYKGMTLIVKKSDT